MRRRLALSLPVLAALAAAQPRQAAARPPPARIAALARGLNVSHWFRFPPEWSDRHFEQYLTDADLAALRANGFTHLRLPLDPAVIALPDGRLHRNRLAQLETAVRRIAQAGLAAVVEPHPVRSEPIGRDPAATAQVAAIWRDLAPAMARLPAERVFLEILSEPVFRGNEAAWFAMQRDLHAQIRAAAPAHTIIATGAEWSSLEALLRLAPLPDPNVVYTFHFYWPMAFTHQGADWVGPAFRGLRGLPWPAQPAEACLAALPAQPDAQAQRTAEWYCRAGFDAARLVREVARAREWADRHGVVVWVGEFGGGCYVGDRATRLRYLRDARLAFEAAGFGWALWGLDNCQGIGADRRARDFRIPADMLAALGLPGR